MKELFWRYQLSLTWKETNMKKIIFIFIMILFFAPMAFAEDVRTEEKSFNGYEWKKFPEAVKAAYVSGYLQGYLSGFAKQAFEIKHFLSKYGDKKCSEKIENMIKNMEYEGISFEQDFSYYVREVDSFYQIYPLCKRMDFEKLMALLVEVWILDEQNYLTYKEIGERCLIIQTR